MLLILAETVPDAFSGPSLIKKAYPILSILHILSEYVYFGVVWIIRVELCVETDSARLSKTKVSRVIVDFAFI